MNNKLENFCKFSGCPWFHTGYKLEQISGGYFCYGSNCISCIWLNSDGTLRKHPIENYTSTNPLKILSAYLRCIKNENDIPTIQ
jgi:hypothetical protein